MTNNEHTYKQFDIELESIRSRVLRMGGLIEQQIIKAIEGLTTLNLEIIDQVIVNDHLVNSMEVEIDEQCNHIIALRQPAAGDLRMIMTVVKTITDLERMGDEAEKIARMGKLICNGDLLKTPRFNAIASVSDLVLEMLRKALDSFARLDVTTAVQVVRQDLQVDEAFRAILRQLITFMMEDPRTISTSIEILFVAKALERIGDHAKNIAEYVVFMVKGKDVRHVNVEDVEREAME
jgi:phosphate transport system protein